MAVTRHVCEPDNSIRYERPGHIGTRGKVEFLTILFRYEIS